MSRMQHPLPASFFKCPPLSPAETRELTALAMKNAADMVKKTKLRGGPYEWRLLADAGDLKIYKGKPTDGLPGTSLICSTIELVGTLEEVAELFRTDTTERAKAYVKRFGRGLRDAVHLYTIRPSTPTDPFEKIGIQWILGDSSLDMFVRRRDSCVLQCDHEFVSEWGTRGWVRGFKSVDMDCCPDFEKALGFVRANNMGSGHVFVESPTRPGYLQVHYFYHLNAKGAQWLTDAACIRRCRSLQDIDLFLRENRLNSTPFLSVAELVPPSQRRDCYLCQRRFTSFNRKCNCFKCGEVFCASCTPYWRVQIDGRETKLQACTRCAQMQVHRSKSRSAQSDLSYLDDLLRHTSDTYESVNDDVLSTMGASETIDFALPEPPTAT